MKRLAIFSGLQLVDALTTLEFLRRGVQEANPVIRLLMQAHSPLQALLFVKVAAFALAGVCVVMHKWHFLTRVNIGFAALVVWNLIAIEVA